MKFEKKVKFVSSEIRESKKNAAKYSIVTLTDGEATEQFYCPNIIQSEFGKEFVAEFQYNAKFGNMSLIGSK